jgi:hypothetical protein
MYISDTGKFFANRPETREESIVYDYIRRLGQESDPQQVIDAFYELFFKGLTWHELDPDRSAQKAFQKLLTGPSADESFIYVINRCFYTIGNRWRLDTSRHLALKSLINRAVDIPQKTPNVRHTRSLRRYIHAYVSNDDLYVPLKRQMKLLTEEGAGFSESTQPSLGDCFKDYFFIYESASVTPDIPLAYRKEIQKQRQQQAQLLNQDLLAYYRQDDYTAGIAKPNPTRIPDQELRSLIEVFRPDDDNSYFKQAHRFESHSLSIRRTQDFRDDFYDYVMSPLVEADHRFADRFGSSVREALADNSGEGQSPITSISINLMCTRLLKVLVSNSLEAPCVDHLRRLINTVGHQVVTAMLLKIVLFRRTIRYWLEDRFAILFHKWESEKLEQIPWLVQSFEYMNVALALNAKCANYI